MITDTILNFNDVTKIGLTLTLTVFKKTSDASNVAPPIISELSDGFYKFSFDVEAQDSDIYYVADDAGTNVLTGVLSQSDNANLQVQLDRILGLNQENQFIDTNVYDGNGNLTNSRLRIYSVAGSVGTTNDVLATYNMLATYTGNNLDTFQVIKA